MENEAKKYISKKVIEIIKEVNASRIREAGKRQSIYTTTTTGALVLSISFLSISGFENLVSGNVLIVSWVFLSVAIIINLISYISVDLYFKDYLKNIRKWRDDGMDFDKPFNEDTLWWGKATRLMNHVGYVVAIIGLILMVLFGIMNINTMNKNTKITGQTTQSPQSVRKTADTTVLGPSISDIINSRPTGSTSSTPQVLPKPTSQPTPPIKKP